jgi:hypothetical protein
MVVRGAGSHWKGFPQLLLDDAREVWRFGDFIVNLGFVTAWQYFSGEPDEVTSVFDLRFGVLERALDGLVPAETTLLMVIDSALLSEPAEPSVCTEPSVCVLDSREGAVESSTNPRRASGEAISISAALLFIEPCKLYMLSRVSITGFIFSRVFFFHSRLVTLGARALDDCMMIGLGRGLRMELSVEPKLEVEVLGGT